jgi:hypothetical protein
LSVFADALAAGWEDWSWESAVRLDVSSPIHSGAAAVGVTYRTASAGFSLRAPQLIDTAGFGAISFWAYGSGSGNALLIYTEGGDSGPISPAQAAINLPANRWTQVTIPLSALGNPAQIKRINIQERTGAAQATFYLDDMQLMR